MIVSSPPSMLWASIIADELALCGIEHAVISPGSRSTPLTLTLAHDARIRAHTVLDERAAAFFALGIGKSTGRPAALVCTSGTAAANYLPAVIEASQSGVPMILLTADRPPELRGTGANQTIDQVRLYGDYVRYFADIAPPEAEPSDALLRSLRTTVDRAAAHAAGWNAGPVHLNISFRKPLEPAIGTFATTAGAGNAAPQTIVLTPSEMSLAPADYAMLAGEISLRRRGLIVCGPNMDMDAGSIADLARLTGYPVIADPLSNIRFADSPAQILGAYETYLQGDFAREHPADLIIQLGDLPVSAALLTYMDQQENAVRITATKGARWADGAHRTTYFVRVSPQALASGLFGALDVLPADTGWRAAFNHAEQAAWDVIEEALYSAQAGEGAVLADVVSGIDRPASLFVGNSNAMRHLDQFTRPAPAPITLFGNRGASGIDGNLATALGIAAADDLPTTAVLGDVTLYHDLNSLHLIRRLQIENIVIVVINNDGGGIFHRLPVAKQEDAFVEYFQTPHGLRFEHAARMFDIAYLCAGSSSDFRAAYRQAVQSGKPHLIEVPSSASGFESQRQAIIAETARRLANIKEPTI